ncbi:YrhB domain-containing protein [Streptomyces sp. NPDC050564]|uniref:YrhB domain-containing protein n=1 Tax=Streptomyces sp. NPDC050564 TaxID=3365631 RepID=UPI003794B08C
MERKYQKWSAGGGDSTAMTVADVEEHELVWIVCRQSEEFVRTGHPGAMLVGNGPYLVDRVDGGLYQIGVISAVGGESEADYRFRIRGLAVRTAAGDLHDEIREVAAAGGRMQLSHPTSQAVGAVPGAGPSST